MPLRVKEKSAWKSVKLPGSNFNEDDFDGLVEIQELTDYELVFEEEHTENEEGDDADPYSQGISKKRKRQDTSEEATENKSSKKKNKRKGKKTNTDSINSENGQVESPMEQDGAQINTVLADAVIEAEGNVKEQSKTKKKRKRKKKAISDPNMINSEDVEVVTGEEEVVNSGENQTTLSEKTAKKLGKKTTVGSLIQEENKNTIQVDASKGNPSQKKNKKNKYKHSDHANQLPNTKLEEEESNEGKEEESYEDEEEDIDMSEWKNLYVPDEIMQALKDAKFAKPTLIQQMALPNAIRDRKDILGAAETGSGKTLAFGIPILARILDARARETSDTEEEEEVENTEEDGASEEAEEEDNVESGEDDEESEDEEDQTEEEDEAEDDFEEEGDVASEDEMSSTLQDKEENMENISQPKQLYKRPPLALILEPTRELAVQVRKHLVSVARHTNIKFANVVGGMSVDKQRRVLGKHPEVIIATPGRLWQLIEEGNEHLCQIDRILCLAVDEADRMVEKGHYEELTKLFELLNKSPRRAKNRQTFVMSATLTMDISAPKRLQHKGKRAPVDEDKIQTLIETICTGQKPKVIDLTPEDKVAHTLSEMRINCKNGEKDLYLYYFLCRHPGRTLVFVNSKDCLRRLISLFSLLECSPLPLHADMQQRQRLKNLDNFAEKKQALLVASDVAARGLDIPAVDHVIHYQVPRTMENYVHRSGRTARASNQGLSVMLVSPEDAKSYRKIIYGVRNGEELSVLPVDFDLMPAVRQRVSLASEIDVTQYRVKKKKVKNNFFIKAAEEMDMIIDDPRLLEDLGDSMEQATASHKLKQMKTQLSRMLVGSLAPLHRTKYPTSSGRLNTRKPAELLYAT